MSFSYLIVCQVQVIQILQMLKGFLWQPLRTGITHQRHQHLLASLTEDTRGQLPLSDITFNVRFKYFLLPLKDLLLSLF